MPSLAGTKLDKYEVLEEVGHGGMAVVYRGIDSVLKREVAIKVLHPHLADRAESRARLEREAIAVAKLRHENILEIFDYSAASTGTRESYIVTEFIHGPTLRDWLDQDYLARPAVAALVVHRLALALVHAHKSSIVHRDIKPENVFLHRIPAGEIVKVLDFGIAKLIEADDGRQETRGMLLGTLGFVAPERVLGLEYGAPSDIYSVGVLFYTMLTGLPPFYPKPDEEPLATLMRQVNEPVPPLDVPGLPQAAIGLVERMLATIASERPTARELVDELARFRRK